MPSYVWEREGLGAGLDHAAWMEAADGIVVAGSEIAVDQGRPWSVRFSVRLDGGWRTREVEVVAIVDDGHRRLQLEADGNGSWTVEGEHAPVLGGCIDVDISATPISNTFVIRRLGLVVGESIELVAAWIAVPELEIVRLRQTYTRLDPVEGLDRYEYRDERFGRWLLTVDGDGVVVDYAGFARRVS